MEWKEVGLEGSRYNASLTFGLLQDGSGYYFETTVNPIDADMYWNPTTHAYFNLGGSDSDPGDQLLTIPAENILETDQNMIPTGEAVPAGEVDFSTERKTGDSNLDYYFVLSASEWDGLVTKTEFEQKIRDGVKLAHVATLRHPATGIVMDVTSNVFGVQVFNGWEKRVAIEPMTMPPNAINLEQFREGAIARRGQTYVQRTECRFSLSPAENFPIG